MRAEELADAKRKKDVDAELQLVLEREALLPRRLEEYATLTTAEEARVLQDRNVLEAEGKTRRDKLRSLRESVAAYGERLGLTFSQTEDEKLTFVFTQIDERFPHEEFCVNVHVSDERKYEVTECSPEIADMESMLEKLNTDSDFSAFIRATRRAFRKIAAERRGA